MNGRVLVHCLHSQGDKEKLKPYSGGALSSIEGDASPDLGRHVEAMSISTDARKFAFDSR